MDDLLREAREIARHLYSPDGGIIVQLEMGPSANPDTAVAVFEKWDRVVSTK